MSVVRVTQRRSATAPTSASATRCARSVCGRIGQTSSTTTRRSCAACSTRSAISWRWRSDERHDEQPQERIGLHNLKPAPGSRRPRKRVGRGEGSGHRQDLRPRPEGPWLAQRRTRTAPASRAARCRSHADAQAARPAHEEVDAVRAVPHPHPAGQPRATSTRFEAGDEVTLEALKAKGLATPQGIPVKVLAKGELDQAVDRHAPRLQRAARAAIEAAGGSLPDRSPCGSSLTAAETA